MHAINCTRPKLALNQDLKPRTTINNRPRRMAATWLAFLKKKKKINESMSNRFRGILQDSPWIHSRWWIECKHIDQRGGSREIIHQRSSEKQSIRRYRRKSRRLPGSWPRSYNGLWKGNPMRGRPIQSDLQIGINVKPRANNARPDWLTFCFSLALLIATRPAYTHRLITDDRCTRSLLLFATGQPSTPV